jgi:hypothetical protein
MEMLTSRRHAKNYSPLRAALPGPEPIEVVTQHLSRAKTLRQVAAVFGLDDRACDAIQATRGPLRQPPRPSPTAGPTAPLSKADDGATTAAPTAPTTAAAPSTPATPAAAAAPATPATPASLTWAAEATDLSVPTAMALGATAMAVTEAEQADLRTLCTLAECEDSKVLVTAMALVNRCRLAIAAARFAPRPDLELNVRQECFSADFSHRNRVLIGVALPRATPQSP